MSRRAAPALLGVLLLGAADAAPPGAAGAALGEPAAAGFAQVTSPRPFLFPQDHGPHGEYRQEWWYFTGHLDGGGAQFGFELTFFRFALAPPGPTPAGASAWRAREMYMAHFAVTDIARQHFAYAQKFERAALGLAGAQGAPLSVWLDDWSLIGGPGAAEAPNWQLHAAQAGYELQLVLEPTGAPVPNGDAGLSVKSAARGSASYYYSLPRMRAQGTLVRGGVRTAVSGEAWFDHEWGSAPMDVAQAGWDWFALQLNDGSTLMFYALRDRRGQREAHSAGTFVDAQGARRALSSAEVLLTPTGTWTSADGVRYPSGWHLQVPALGLDLDAQPVLKDQELHVSPRYWEGAVAVHGSRAGAPVGGRGYVELVGYAQER